MIKVKAILTLEKGYKFFISLFKTSFTWQTYCVHGSFKKHNETPLEFTKNKGFRPQTFTETPRQKVNKAISVQAYLHFNDELLKCIKNSVFLTKQVTAHHKISKVWSAAAVALKQHYLNSPFTPLLRAQLPYQTTCCVRVHDRQHTNPVRANIKAADITRDLEQARPLHGVAPVYLSGRVEGAHIDLHIQSWSVRLSLFQQYCQNVFAEWGHFLKVLMSELVSNAKTIQQHRKITTGRRAARGVTLELEKRHLMNDIMGPREEEDHRRMRGRKRFQKPEMK